MSKKTKNLFTGKTVKIFASLLILLLLGLSVWRITDRKAANVVTTNHSSAATKTPAESTPAVNNSKTLGQNKSAVQPSPQQSSSTPTNTSMSVTPIITSSTHTTTTVGVFAFVQGVIENGGTCTLTLTNGSQTFTSSVAASAQGTSTNCGNITIDKSPLTTGETYSAVVTYKSSTSSGASTQSWQIVNQ